MPAPLVGRRRRADVEPASHHDRVRAYYDETWYEYRGLWMNPTTRAIHFGYRDELVRNHQDSLVRMNDELADRLRLDDGDLCLDAGAGVGGTAMWLAETRNVHVVGLTIVPDQTRRMGRYVADRGLEGSVFPVLGDYERTGLRAGAFDAAYTQESLCHAQDKQAVITELASLLRPGGRLLLAEYLATDAPGSDRARRSYDTWIADWCMPSLPSSDDLTQMLREAGLVDVTFEDITPAVVPSLRRLHRLCLATVVPEAALHAVGLRSDTQHANVRGSIRLWQALRAGLWRYGFLVATKP